eukprot:248304_1
MNSNETLVIQKAGEILSGNHNDDEYDESMSLIMGYIRNNIERINNSFIPLDVKKLCQMYNGSMSFIISEKIETITTRLSNEIGIEMKTINERTANVEAELSEGKIPLKAAQKAVSNINKKQLNEIKAECYRNPPKLIELTFFALFTLMGKKIRRWPDCIKLFAANQFIPSILTFDSSTIESKTRKIMNKKYLTNEQFTFKRINKASKVCGPLVLWIKSQIKYAGLLDSVEPMTVEIRELKEKLNIKQKKQFKYEQMSIKLKDIR